MQVVLPRTGVPPGPDIQAVLNGSPPRELRLLSESETVSAECGLTPTRAPQIFKIIAPFVFLSAAFATLNARLGMPPFALFLVALCLTDGARVI